MKYNELISKHRPKRESGLIWSVIWLWWLSGFFFFFFFFFFFGGLKSSRRCFDCWFLYRIAWNVVWYYISDRILFFSEPLLEGTLNWENGGAVLSVQKREKLREKVEISLSSRPLVISLIVTRTIFWWLFNLFIFTRMRIVGPLLAQGMYIEIACMRFCRFCVVA